VAPDISARKDPSYRGQSHIHSQSQGKCRCYALSNFEGCPPIRTGPALGEISGNTRPPGEA